MPVFPSTVRRHFGSPPIRKSRPGHIVAKGLPTAEEIVCSADTPLTEREALMLPLTRPIWRTWQHRQEHSAGSLSIE